MPARRHRVLAPARETCAARGQSPRGSVPRGDRRRRTGADTLHRAGAGTHLASLPAIHPRAAPCMYHYPPHVRGVS